MSFPDEEKERPSWREIDSKRDRSSHVSQPQLNQEKKSSVQKRGETLAKKALEELFQVKKTKEQEAQWKKVCGASGKLFSTRADAYVNKYGLPKEWDDLLRLLDHEEAQFVDRVLERMNDLAVHETSVRIDLLIGKLRILKMLREEPALVSKIEQILKGLPALESKEP